MHGAIIMYTKRQVDHPPIRLLSMDKRELRDSFSYAVDKLMGELTERLHTVIDDLLLKLYDCFTERERQEINTNRINIKKVEDFFRIVKTKDVNSYEKCLTAMEDLNCHDLASNLREEWKSVPQRSVAHGMSLASRKLVYLLGYLVLARTQSKLATESCM